MNALQKNRSAVLIAVIIILTILLPYIIYPDGYSQNPAYHRLAGDSSTVYGMRNALNVLTNIPFFFIGLWGIGVLIKKRGKEQVSGSLFGYFIGVLLTGCGSAYYHNDPNNQTLLFDRLPMTIAFMSLMAATVEYRISIPIGKRLSPFLLLAGALSVLYWYFSEKAGHGDLRPYAIVQFGSITLFPVILWRYPQKKSSIIYASAGLLLYLLAKIFEEWDEAIFIFTGVLAGHPLKHLAASMATLFIGLFLICESKRNQDILGKESVK